ncbi:hypothetical protein BKA61DRAFT_584308 [Leptodontidium sp. MPI-SDFR-AT-0119]|nr:hypothetical protein BKA61DRAFT_584308 [Leptodontidium sp. MPI-SDFR-AT-0119]
MANTDRYTQHVDSIQPTQAEASALRSLDVAFLQKDASWPPLLLNYIYRWMHRHNLYHVGPSRVVIFSALIDSFVQRTSLPPTEPNKSALASKCSALIRESTLQWKRDSLLIQRGCGFSKHILLKAAWAAHEESFRQAESTLFRVLPQVDHCDMTIIVAAGGGVEKRRADVPLRRSTKKQRADDPDNAVTSSSDCSDIDERALQASESGPSTSALPDTVSLETKHHEQEKVWRNQDSESSLSPTPQQSHDEVPGTHLPPAGHQTPLTTVGSAVGEADLQPDEIREPAVVSGTLSQRPSACDGRASSPVASTQDGVRPTAPALPHVIKCSNTTLSVPLPKATSSGHLGTNSPVSVTRAPTPVSILSSPTSRSTARGIEDPNARRQHSPPRRRDSSGQASGAPATKSSGMPPVVNAPTPRLQSPLRQSRRSVAGASQTVSKYSSRGKPNQPLAPNKPLAPNPSYAYEVATLVSRRGHDTATSQRFQSIGRILFPSHNQPMGGFVLGVDTLMSQSVTEFFNHYLGLARNEEYLGGLKFEFLDVITGGHNWSTIVAPNDRTNFQALKQFAFTSFATSLSENPSLEEFRITVTLANDPITSKTYGRNAQPTSSTNPTQATSSKAAQSTHPNFRFESREQFAPHHSLVTSKEAADRGHALTALQVEGIARGSRQRSEAGNPNPTSPQITVHIQVDRFRRMSGPYPGSVLSHRVKNTEFFAWFAREVGFDNCMGPEELTFTFRDALLPKNNCIARGNEEHFDYMKQDMRPVCEHVAARMPGLTEFVILVTVPGWDRKADEW